MSDVSADPLLALAERVASLASELGMATAVIGAAALAAHNYVRGTADVDLAMAVDPFRDLLRLRERLSAEGLHTELELPDADDVLGGVLRVRLQVDDDDSVEVVNSKTRFAPPVTQDERLSRRRSPWAGRQCCAVFVCRSSSP